MECDFLEYLVGRGALSAPRCESIRQTIRSPREPLGGIAFAHGLLSAEDIDLVLSQQRQEHRPFGQIATELGMLTQAQVEMLVKIQHARAALSFAEAISLAGVLSLDAMMTELAGYLAPDMPRVKAA